MVTAAEVEDALRGKLHATDVVRLPCCGSGCGPARGTGYDRRALAPRLCWTRLEAAAPASMLALCPPTSKAKGC